MRFFLRSTLLLVAFAACVFPVIWGLTKGIHVASTWLFHTDPRRPPLLLWLLLLAVQIGCTLGVISLAQRLLRKTGKEAWFKADMDPPAKYPGALPVVHGLVIFAIIAAMSLVLARTH